MKKRFILLIIYIVISINIDIPIFPLSKGGQRGLFTTLIVFDLLGKEVATLVNESALGGQPGTYEVTFNASIFPSGIYFYRLETPDFVQTNKMILLK